MGGLRHPYFLGLTRECGFDALMRVSGCLGLVGGGWVGFRSGGGLGLVFTGLCGGVKTISSPLRIVEGIQKALKKPLMPDRSSRVFNKA